MTNHDMVIELVSRGVPWWLAHEAVATTRMEQEPDD